MCRFLWFIRIVVCWVSPICGLTFFIKFGKFPAIIFSIKYIYIYIYFFFLLLLLSLSSSARNPTTFLIDCLILPNCHWGSVHFSRPLFPAHSPCFSFDIFHCPVFMFIDVFSSMPSMMLFPSTAFFTSIQLSVLNYIMSVWFFYVESTYLLRFLISSFIISIFSLKSLNIFILAI